jgi:hypothetical protein
LDELNQRLQDAFRFTPDDVRANRGGRLSARQRAVLRAAGSNMRLAIMVFVFVMLGTLGVLAFSFVRSGGQAGGAELIGLIVVAGVIGLIILVGVLTSRRYLVSAEVTSFRRAEGIAQPGKIKADAARFEVKIGATKLRLAGEEQLTAFQPGVAYRVFYLPRPVPLILAAEVIGSEAEIDAAAERTAQTPPERDPVVQLQRRARPILYVLGALVFGIPLAAAALGALPGFTGWLVFLVLLAVGVGFVYWSLQRLSE